MNTSLSNLSSKKIRMILKFDTGADGFLKMIYVLAGFAVLTLFIGLYFLLFYFKGVQY